MKRGAESKKAQFYLIAAIVIVFVIISFAVVSNYIYVKQEPQKFYDIGGILKIEGIKVIENAEYNGKNVDDNINDYLGLFENYTKDHPSENFNLVIIYGSVKSEEVNVVQYYPKVNEGGVTLALGQTRSIEKTDIGTVYRNETEIKLNPDGSTVNVTLISGDRSITQQFPVLQDNNFVFMMTTNDGFSQYVQTSLETEKLGS